jgi:hypothetical protein
VRTFARVGPARSKNKTSAAGGHGILVMSDVTDPCRGVHTMTKGEGKAEVIDLKGLLAGSISCRAVEAPGRAALAAEMSTELFERY